MARNVAKLKMGYYPLPKREGTKLRELLTFTGPASVVDPCVGQGTALNLLTHGADVGLLHQVHHSGVHPRISKREPTKAHVKENLDGPIGESKPLRMGVQISRSIHPQVPAPYAV